MDVEVMRDPDSGSVLHVTGYNESGLATGYGMHDGRRYDFEESLLGHIWQHSSVEWEPLPGLDEAPLRDPKKDTRFS
jgi:hypothetical protein